MCAWATRTSACSCPATASRPRRSSAPRRSCAAFPTSAPSPTKPSAASTPRCRACAAPSCAPQEFARRPQGWLIFFGNYGCGKTHLAAAIANEALARHVRVLFTVVPDLLDHLRSTFGPNSDVQYDERFETIRDANLLIIE